MNDSFVLSVIVIFFISFFTLFVRFFVNLFIWIELNKLVISLFKLNFLVYLRQKIFMFQKHSRFCVILNFRKNENVSDVFWSQTPHTVSSVCCLIFIGATRCAETKEQLTIASTYVGTRVPSNMNVLNVVCRLVRMYVLRMYVRM